ncbi:restriction endonuclease [Arenibacter algicola]|uniref:restriction endonuclease n=1 Tax=Arenibacter algicola TaxID=616991 RepID=UPI001C078FBA|nr:restriction endonuclease [Arenibacter algicola]MBU2906753.1 restriction endonuclease [Arenibacter algicola]
MDKKQITIKKSSGDLEPFSSRKLKDSLRNCEVSNNEIDSIISQVTPQLYDGISSEEVHNKVFPILKKYHEISASKYSLKRGIFELGPTGFPFERLIAALLVEKGYQTKVSVVLNGKCVTHEIDVLAEKDGNTYAIECKFHSDPRGVSNVKVPLYINSRFLDVQQQWNSDTLKTTHLKQGWLVTNTRFTIDAINYGKCIGLTLLSWDYPKNNGMKANIDAYGLYPITVLTTLTKKEKNQLIAKNIILVKELVKEPYHLKKMELSPGKINKILLEAGQLCRTKL